MRTPKLITNYGYLSDSALATLASRSDEALRLNANFPQLDPPYEEYAAVAGGYVAKQAVAAGRGSMQDVRAKDEARRELIIMMRRVTTYINNATTISSVQLSSGFYAVADRKALQPPEASSWCRLRDSNRPGELLLDFEAVREAYQYELAIASELDENGQPIWQERRMVSNSRGNFYSPVTDGVTYYFRVRCHNKKGVSAWSPVSFLRARVND